MTMSFDVFFYEVFDEELESLKEYLPETWRCGFTDQTIQETNHLSPPAQLISIRTQSVIPASWSRQLKGILSRSAGFDHLSRFLETSPSSVATGHLFSYSGRAVAEHATMLWLALLRRLPSQLKSIHSFHRDHLTGRECPGRTLAVFGVGDIGYQVAVIGRALGMKVLGVDIIRKHSDIEYAEKDTAIACADVAVCAMNLNETNDGYFTQEALARLPGGCIFINVARGEFARSSDLVAALEAGRLGGVGLDVYAGESMIATALRNGKAIDHPEYLAFRKLLLRDDVILTPHNAFNTREALARKSLQSVRQIDHFFTHGSFSPVKLQE